MKSILALAFVLILTVSAFAQTVTSVNSASYTPQNEAAVNSISSLFGTGLSVNTVVANSVPLPTTLDGVTVTVGGQPAGLFFVSPYQINSLCSGFSKRRF